MYRKKNLLLVDDDPESQKSLSRVLEWAGFENIKARLGARQGLLSLETYHPDIIILELQMKGMSGFEFLETLHKDYPTFSNVPVLVFTSELNPEVEKQAKELGVSEFIKKPGNTMEVQLKIKKLIEAVSEVPVVEQHDPHLEVKVAQLTKALISSWQEAIEVLAGLSAVVDPQFGPHAKRVAELSANISIGLGQELHFTNSIRLAALLFDIGKFGVPESILYSTQELSLEERNFLKHHVAIGAHLLDGKTSPILQMARDITLYHHEQWNGRGYESGISGKEIPLSARIVAVADEYDSLVNGLFNNKKLTSEKALQSIRERSGSDFDPAVVKALELSFSSYSI